MVQKKHIGIAVIAVIIIIIVAAVSLTILSGAIGVSGPTKLTLTSNPTVVKIGGSQYVLLLSSADPASGTAYVLIGKSPIFVTQTLNVTLPLNEYTEINVGTTYANMEIELNSITNDSASVTIAPVSASLDTPPTSGRITVVSTTGKTTTSVVLAVSSTTIATTTTINQTASDEQRIQTYLSKSVYYPLLANYSIDFANAAANCTSDLYNTSYRLEYATSPSGPTTYQNVTAVTPYSMSYSIVPIGGSTWAVLYTTTSPSSFTTGVALNITMNVTSGAIINTTFTGVWKDESADSLRTGLGDASSVGNACGILVYV